MRHDIDRRILRRGLAVLRLGVREHPGVFGLALAGGALYAVMLVASAAVVGAVTDRVVVPAFERGSVRTVTLVLAATAILGVALLKVAGILLRRVSATYVEFKLQSTYRERVAHRYNALPLAWHRRHSVGTLLSVVNADVDAAFWPLAPLPFSVAALIMLAVTAVLLLLTDPFLAAVGLLVGPAILLINWRYNRMVAAPARRAQELRGSVSRTAHESFDGALVVKTLGLEAAETKRFAADAEALRGALVDAGRIRAVYDPLMEALPQIAVLLVLLLGAWRIAAEQLTVGVLVQFSYLFTLLGFPVRAIGWVLADLPRAVVGWERVVDVLRADDALPAGDDGEVGHGPAHVEVDNVSFAYDTATVLDGLTFDVPPGRTVALVGPTGAGKSTVAALLARLDDPHRGAVRVGGRDLRSLTRPALSRQVAVVFQESFLFDDTVRENITLGEPFTDDEVRHAAALAQAHAFISALPYGYDTHVGERGVSLSGGQRQRVALARALVRRPRVLVLDDATSSVDPTVEAAILHGLAGAELPSTLVLIAYRRATIALADEVLFLHDARVAARGSHEDLLARVPAYAQLLTAYERRAAPEPAA